MADCVNVGRRGGELGRDKRLLTMLLGNVAFLDFSLYVATSILSESIDSLDSVKDDSECR
jgi:hypothetical protein